MTRTHTTRPVWTWKCDFCGREFGLGREQSALYKPVEMEQFGWTIATVWGDRCPSCVAALIPEGSAN